MDERILALISKEELDIIKNKKILLVGVGGVGGFVLEALVRSGFSNITIVDGDIIDISNLNRQIITNINNIGLSKVLEAKKRAININKNISIKTIDIFLTKDNFNNYINEEYDYIIDACDDINIKVLLIKYAKEHNIKIITCLGTGKKLDARYLEVTTLNKTFNDPLAKKLRYLLRKENISLNIPVVFSKEVARDTHNIIGSVIFVPSGAGILIANKIFLDGINSFVK